MSALAEIVYEYHVFIILQLMRWRGIKERKQYSYKSKKRNGSWDQNEWDSYWKRLQDWWSTGPMNASVPQTQQGWCFPVSNAASQPLQQVKTCQALPGQLSRYLQEGGNSQNPAWHWLRSPHTTAHSTPDWVPESSQCSCPPQTISSRTASI